MLMRALFMRHEFPTMTVSMKVHSSIVNVAMEMYPITPKLPQHIPTHDNQHDADRKFQPFSKMIRNHLPKQ